MPVTASIKTLQAYHTYGREQKKSATINDSGLGAGASSCWRRWRDLNSRYGFAVLPHFECGPFSHLGTSPCVNYTIIQVITKKVKPFVQI